MPAKKIILTSEQSPGDILMMTAAVRDLHKAHPRVFKTDVRTPTPQLWENNPYITPISDGDPHATKIEMHYPLIHKSNDHPYHFIHGYRKHLQSVLNKAIPATQFRGDIHLSDEEKNWPSQVEELGFHGPCWIIIAGGKHDFTAKWWNPDAYQEVVDYFRGKIQFVQCGQDDHWHPRLQNVIDLVGKTDVRQFVRLMYHADGVVCPVTFAMHLAATVETKPEKPRNRAAVVIAGGREPPHWEAYPHHRFLSTNGALRCCEDGGCWKARCQPVEDESDLAHSMCENPVDLTSKLRIPQCMDMISSGDVIRAVEMYYAGGALKYLDASQVSIPCSNPVESNAAIESVRDESMPLADGENKNSTCDGNTDMAIDNLVQKFADGSPDNLRQNWWREEEIIEAHRRLSRQVIEQMDEYKGGEGRGIVICAGGTRLFTNAWVCIRMLRHHGCDLPIQVWYLGEDEFDQEMASLVRPYGVECVDGTGMRDVFPARRLGGWELKSYAILHSPFQEVALLDADNVPLVDPEFLFNDKRYLKCGAVFWPDYNRLAEDREIWDICEVEFRDEPEFESGQIVVDKRRCWDALNLAMHYNEHSDFYYQYVHGDKETFHLAFRRVNRPYAMPKRGIDSLNHTMCQHDFDGRRIFQHRNLDKWQYHGENAKIRGFRLEDVCFRFIAELRELWNGRVHWQDQPTALEESLIHEVANQSFIYERVGFDERPMQLRADRTIGTGAARLERSWTILCDDGRPRLVLHGEKGIICILRADDRVWNGKWLKFEKMPIRFFSRSEPQGQTDSKSDANAKSKPGANGSHTTGLAGKGERHKMKMFGLQRCCTNIVCKLLLGNFDVESIERSFEWKHGRIGRVRDAVPDAYIIHCVRNPYAWLEACYRFFLRTCEPRSARTDPAFRRDWSFEDFLTRKHYDFESPVHRWNEMNTHWLEQVEKRPSSSITIRAEMVYGSSNQEQEMLRVKNLFEQWNWQPKRGPERIFTSNNRVGHGNLRFLKKKFDSTFFENREYLGVYTPKLLEHVNSMLDHKLMQRLDYEIESPADSTDDRLLSYESPKGIP